ncbi:hypothetical protein AMTR_s00167p00042230 [Amborella trichopoda]|uniref:Uncharacterized protein n=1 Tax=Amborella trichopoda TaxID=13333 RepID=W1PSQ5_AMBTC|nr:hypothetical protein AMTR_s00167p00042230 [Amborella trichopoda]
MRPLVRVAGSGLTSTCVWLGRLAFFSLDRAGLWFATTVVWGKWPLATGYWRWWDSSNADYWGVAHPWQADGGSRCDGRATNSLFPPPFSIIFCLDHYSTNWQELVKPCSLSGDEEGMKLLSLKRRTRSFFYDLEAIFGWSERGVHPSCEEGLAPTLSSRIEGQYHSGSSVQASHTSKPPSSIKPKNTPPKEREDRERERERQRESEGEKEKR